VVKISESHPEITEKSAINPFQLGLNFSPFESQDLGHGPGPQGWVSVANPW